MHPGALSGAQHMRRQGGKTQTTARIAAQGASHSPKYKHFAPYFTANKAKKPGSIEVPGYNFLVQSKCCNNIRIDGPITIEFLVQQNHNALAVWRPEGIFYADLCNFCFSGIGEYRSIAESH